MEKINELAKTIDSLTLNEARQLIDVLMNKYGYKPTVTTVETSAKEEKVEKTEFNVVLTKINDKLKLIKAYNKLVSGKLMESKAFIEQPLPLILREATSKEEAEMWKNTLMENEYSIIEIK